VLRRVDGADITKDAIEAHHIDLANAIFRFISRNETKPILKASDEDLLDEIVVFLGDRYKEDLNEAKGKPVPRQEDREIGYLYPKFLKAAKAKSEEVKDIAGYKRLLAVPSFTLALVMMTRIRRQFRRAKWFKVGTLGAMIECHGAVSEQQREATLLTRDRAQVVADFIVRSIEDLERIANPQEPPLSLTELTKISEEYTEVTGTDREALDQRLVPMESAFFGRGDPEIWPEDILAKIDKCFIENYCDASGEPCDCLFYPSHAENIDKFAAYCAGVDAILRDNRTILPYAREYFTYATLWEKRGERFPVPLGTASVVEALHVLLKKYTRGLTEVRSDYCILNQHLWQSIRRPTVYSLRACVIRGACCVPGPRITGVLYAVLYCCVRGADESSAYNKHSVRNAQQRVCCVPRITGVLYAVLIGTTLNWSLVLFSRVLVLSLTDISFVLRWCLGSAPGSIGPPA
jgi:hypothetical protein